MSKLSANDFKGTAKRIEDIDLPRIGETIGVGEDVLHALIEVETRGTGFDSKGRVIILFEPHVFYRNLRGAKRQEAVDAGLAYRRWGEKPYPRDSYPRLLKAIEIDETAALKACSWGMAQILGENYEAAGYGSPQAMVLAFAEDEDDHLEAMVNFIIANGIDDDLRRIEEKVKAGKPVTAADWIPVVRVYNGAGYAKNSYHIRAANAFNRWLKIKDTPYAKENLKDAAAKEEAVKVKVEESVTQPVTEKGETSGTQPTEDIAGTPPPAPAVEVKASGVPLWTRITSLSIPTGIMTVLGGIFAFAKELPPYAWISFSLIAVAAMVIGYLIYRDSKHEAHERTKIVLTAAADPDRNNLRLV